MAKRPPGAVLSVPAELIERKIYLVRGYKIMLDTDLAVLYEVPTYRLNEAVKCHSKRFPEDFMFQLTREESRNLTSQNAMSSFGHGGRRTLPYAFTEHGVAMLSSVLNSERAVQVNIAIVRAFVKLREWIVTHKELALKMDELERTQKEQAAHIGNIYEVLEQLTSPAEVPPARRIGFVTEDA